MVRITYESMINNSVHMNIGNTIFDFIISDPLLYDTYFMHGVDSIKEIIKSKFMIKDIYGCSANKVVIELTDEQYTLFVLRYI